MKKFVIKDIIHDTKTGETFTYYTGTDDYVHDTPEYADGYKSAKVAQKKIDREKAFYLNLMGGAIINESSVIESHRWIHTYTIVEVNQ